MKKKFLLLILMCLFGGLSSQLMAQFNITYNQGAANQYTLTFTPIEGSTTCAVNMAKGNSPKANTELIIPETVTNGGTTYTVVKIPNNAFRGTNAYIGTDSDYFTRLVIPNSVTSIGSYAFQYWSNCTEVVLGSGLTTISSNAFSYSSAISTIYCYAETPPTATNSSFAQAVRANALVYVPATSIEEYKKETISGSGYGWAYFALEHFQAIASDTPPTVTLTSPENGATEIFRPNLEFTLGSAKQYQIQMAEGTDDFSTIQDWTEGNGSISYQTNLLKPNTTYSWKVVAKNDDGETTSETFTFTTKEFAAPGVLVSVSPEDDATDLVNPKLEWKFGENTEQQQVIIDGETKVDWTNIGTKTGDSYQTSGLASGEHTWQINTKNGAGETTGTVYSFTVASLPDNVTAILPTNGATNVSSKTIKWQFAENTTHYRFLYGEAVDQLAYVSKYGGSTWQEIAEGVTEMELEAPYFATGTTYYWAVDVKNPVGQRTVYQGGETINVYSFTTGSTLPVVNTAPANDTTNLDNPILKWNYDGNATQYQVYLGKEENNLSAVTEWTAVAGTNGSYQTANLDGSTEYFWRVDVKDESNNTITGPVWSFVTTLPAPTNVVANPAQVVPTLSMTYGSTTISWDNMNGANGYNVYLGTTKLNDELITETSYVIAANRMILAHNMDPGYDIYVEAVYSLGTSTSEAVNVKVTGAGRFMATIYSSDWSSRLAGATVTLTCTEDEFGNVYEGDGRQYEFTTNSNGQACEIVELPSGETSQNTELKLYNGTYAVSVTKTYYESFDNGSVTISQNQTSELYQTGTSQYAGVILIPDNNYIFTVTPFNASFETIDVYLENSGGAGQYYVYLRNGEEITELDGMQDFVYDANNSVYFKYEDWGSLGKGNYEFGVAKAEDQINWSGVVARNYDVFETEGSWNAAENWRDNELPTEDAEVYVLAAATIDDDVTVGTVNIKGDGSNLTINGSLTADNVINAKAGDVIMNDGAQLRQNNNKLTAKFVMDIENPTDWSAEGNTDGWQFIASPFTNAAISNFTTVTGGYDLFKFDGTQAGAEWVNQNKEEEEEDNGNDNIIHKSRGDFETTFVNGRGYLASYQEATTATLNGNVNSTTTHNYTVSYDANSNWANFHLLGNPFTFDMDWTNVVTNGLADGFVTIDPKNGYEYHANGTIAVGDGFFVKAIAEDPTISYSEGTSKRNDIDAESINLIATGKAGKDNVVINLNEEKEGFNKLDNFNKNIASIFVSKDNKRYGIASYDKNVTEIPVCFDAKQMGNYTIAAQPQGKFESVILLDRFTGIETNLLVADYSFTATGSDDFNRFIVKLEVNGQEPTANSNFVYQSGEELILSEEGTVQIIDMMGRVVYTSNVEDSNNRIDVSTFNNAAYVIRVINENGVKVQKVVIY